MKSEREFMDSVLEKTEKAEKAAGIRRRKIFTGAGIAAALAVAVGAGILGRGWFGGRVNVPSQPTAESEDPSVTGPAVISGETLPPRPAETADPSETVPGETEEITFRVIYAAEPERPAVTETNTVWASVTPASVAQTPVGAKGIQPELEKLIREHPEDGVWFYVSIGIRLNEEDQAVYVAKQKEVQESWMGDQAKYDQLLEELWKRLTGEEAVRPFDPDEDWRVRNWYSIFSDAVQTEAQRTIQLAPSECFQPYRDEAVTYLRSLGAKDISGDPDYNRIVNACMTAAMVEELASSRPEYVLDAAGDPWAVTDAPVISPELRAAAEGMSSGDRADVIVVLRGDHRNHVLSKQYYSVGKYYGSARNEVVEELLPTQRFASLEEYLAATEDGNDPLWDGEDVNAAVNAYLDRVILRNGLESRVWRRSDGNGNYYSLARQYTVGISDGSDYFNSLEVGFNVRGLTGVELLLLAEDPDVKLIICTALYSQALAADGVIQSALAAYLPKMEEGERVGVRILPDISGYGAMTWDEQKAALLEKFGWNQDVDADHEVTLEEMDAYIAYKNELMNSPWNRAGQAVFDRLTEAGILTEASDARLATWGGIEAKLTKEEILAAAKTEDVASIGGMDIQNDTPGVENPSGWVIVPAIQ